jgi:hypothetical protein
MMVQPDDPFVTNPLVDLWYDTDEVAPGFNASQIAFKPTGTIAATNVQSAIVEAVTDIAPHYIILDQPAGTPNGSITAWGRVGASKNLTAAAGRVTIPAGGAGIYLVTVWYAFWPGTAWPALSEGRWDAAINRGGGNLARQQGIWDGTTYGTQLTFCVTCVLNPAEYIESTLNVVPTSTGPYYQGGALAVTRICPL